MVHGLAAAGLDHGNQRIADAWCKLQLLTKWEQLTHEAFPLSMPFADIFAVHQEEYEAYVKRQFAKSTPHPKCLVLDGNQKLTRRTCAEQLVDLQSIPGTPYFFCRIATEHHVENLHFAPVMPGRWPAIVESEYAKRTASVTAPPPCSKRFHLQELLTGLSQNGFGIGCIANLRKNKCQPAMLMFPWQLILCLAEPSR